MHNIPAPVAVEIAVRKHARQLADYQPPVADLAYCACGNVWNMDAMEAARFPRNECPDCGAAPVWIETAEQEPPDAPPTKEA